MKLIECKCIWKDYYDYRIISDDGKAHVRVSFFKDGPFISDLYVDKDYRGKRYATILLDRVDLLTHNQKAAIVALERWQEDWYKRRGYEIIDPSKE